MTGLLGARVFLLYLLFVKALAVDWVQYPNSADCTGASTPLTLGSNDLTTCVAMTGGAAAVSYQWKCHGQIGSDVRIKTTCGPGGIQIGVINQAGFAKMKAGECFASINANEGSFKIIGGAAALTYPPCKDTTTTTTVFSPPRVCDCQDEWDWKGVTYKGCAETPDWPDAEWCFVENNECIVSQVSAEFGETRKYVQCDSCDCQRIWLYKTEVYHGCAETPDWAGVDWCYVKGNTCITSKASIIAGETRRFKECGVCNCLNSWHYGRQTAGDALTGFLPKHMGCSTTPDTPNVNWCYVQGMDGACNYASRSVVAAENRQFRDCNHCNCMSFWNYKGAIYRGCAQTPDWAGVDWCYVDGGASCNVASKSIIAGERRYFRQCGPCNCQREWNYKGAMYKGCAETPDWPDTHWCYVSGYDKCIQAKTSEIAGEKRMFRQCDSCNCQRTWNYKGAVYHGCSETPDWVDKEWCYVHGVDCMHAKVSEIADETRMFRQCGACNCMRAWNYKGVVYHGCAETPDWANTEWCYVQGGPECIQSLKSTVAGEYRMFRQCEPCNCQRVWNYKGAVYHGCAMTPDWANTEWCYVRGGDGACNQAKKSEIAGETRMFRQCHSCDCMRRWNYKGAIYRGCAETPDWANTHWCYVQGGPQCTGAKLSIIAGEHRMFRECTPCNCMHTWNYKGSVYNGCAMTPDWPDTEWCYVQGGPACGDAKKSEIAKEPRMFRLCGIVCADVKHHYKEQKCCGNPTKEFKVPAEFEQAMGTTVRRLISSDDVIGQRILAHISDVLREARMKGADVDRLENDILSATKKFL